MATLTPIPAVVEKGLMLANCRFCTQLSRSDDSLPRRPWDVTLLESANFLAWPSLGGFVEGWVLVVPKYHALSMAEVAWEDRPELDDVLRNIFEDVERAYGPTAAFEHGPVKAAQPPGCGVDHAHVHVVPCGADLRIEIEATLGRAMEWESLDSLSMVRSERELPYVSIRNATGRSYVCFDPDIPSQLGRKALGRLHQEPVHDWRQDPHAGTVARTAARLTAVRSPAPASDAA
jgi:diadenosine tetraphosphate (Ap4A) HIT family hydrolase